MRPAVLPDKVAARHRYQLPVWETPLQVGQGLVILGTIEYRHQDTVVQDQEVDIAAGQTLSVLIINGFRDLYGLCRVGLTICLPQCPDLLRHRLEWLIMNVIAARTAGIGDGVRVAESHQVVDMAVGIVAL